MIPASLLIIIVPLIAAIPAYLFRRWRVIEVPAAVVACGFIILLLAEPTGSTLKLGILTINIGAAQDVLGRVLAVRTTDRIPLLILFSAAAVLFTLSWCVSQGWSFVPLGLGVLSLMSAGMMIRPFVFAALAFEAAAALIAIMIQSERSGGGSTVGALRFLTLSTLALPAFLGAGYAVTQASAIVDPTLQAAAYSPAVMLLIIGFGLLFGAFPLFTWTHAVAHDAPPLTTAFLATISSGAITFLFLAFRQEFGWFQSSPDLASGIKLLGIVTLLLGALLGWAQKSFARVVACGLCVEIGSTMLILNSGAPLAVEAITFGLAARVVSLSLIGLGMTLLRHRAGSDEFARVCGMGREQPWIAMAIGFGGMSLAGFPGTIGFVTRWVTVRALGPGDPELLVLMLVASASVGAGIMRGLMALMSSSRRLGNNPNMPRTPLGAVFGIVVMIVVVITLGIAPGILAPITKVVAEAYTFYH